MKTSSKTGKKVKKTIPWSLHMAIVRLQGTEELEYEEACAHAAMLIEEGGERFKEEVKAEANRLYKSRFMGEQNKAKNTWIQKGFNSGYNDGMEKGINLAKDRFQISYPCACDVWARYSSRARWGGNEICCRAPENGGMEAHRLQQSLKPMKHPELVSKAG